MHVLIEIVFCHFFLESFSETIVERFLKLSELKLEHDSDDKEQASMNTSIQSININGQNRIGFCCVKDE